MIDDHRMNSHNNLSSHGNLNPNKHNYLTALNEEQRLAVTTTEGPVLVLSGAGTGKTKVLTSRIAYLLENNLATSREIFAVTFTNKAAAEMKNRIYNILGDMNRNIMSWMGTFHSLGVKILRYNADLVGLSSKFTIISTDDSIKLLKQIFLDEGIDIKKYPPKNFAKIIDNWKNRALTPDDLPDSEAKAEKIVSGLGGYLYKEYQRRLKLYNSCDFGDLLLYPIELFKKYPEILSIYHKKFKYFLVDEYQDTNEAQYIWLKLLARKKDGPTNICCVGDEDQSIYSWRGANINNILSFAKDFGEAKTIRLEKNYRSTKHILSAASNLIAHNNQRLGKILYPADPNNYGSKIKIYYVETAQSESKNVAEIIERLKRENHPLKEMAILVRAIFQLREIEEYFIANGISYRIIGGTRFYDRAEIRDCLAYLRLVLNFNDNLAFNRIINTPKRGLGPKAVGAIHSVANANNISFFEASQLLITSDELTKVAKSALALFVENLLRWQSQIMQYSPADLTKIILDESEYTAIYTQDLSKESRDKLENIKELVSSLTKYDNLAEYIDDINLAISNDNDEYAKDAVNIMTLHTSKGLEFDTVFLTGWEEGLFPHARTFEQDDYSTNLEEERRLAYVGITRARKNLYIFTAANRTIHGRFEPSSPSRFISEMKKEDIEKISLMAGYNKFSSGYPTPGWQRAAALAKNSNKNKSTNILSELGTNSGINSFNIGDKIFHIKFGVGKIIKLDDEKSMLVDFEKAGEKNIVRSFAKLLSAKDL